VEAAEEEAAPALSTEVRSRRPKAKAKAIKAAAAKAAAAKVEAAMVEAKRQAAQEAAALAALVDEATEWEESEVDGAASVEVVVAPSSTPERSSFSHDFARGFEVAAPPFAWSVGFVEMLLSMRQAQGGGRPGQRAAWQLQCGRLAMGAMAFLALHADATHGILHEVLTTQTAELNDMLTTPRAGEPPLTIEDEALDVAFAASLASDVVLQDIPIDALLSQ